MVEASEIFSGFCKCFSSFGITKYSTPSTWKYWTYNYFFNLGRSLGYEVTTEDAFTKKHGIKYLEGMRLDITWTESPDYYDYVLALEYESKRDSGKEIKIINDIMKLTAINCLRVLVMFRQKWEDEEIYCYILSAIEHHKSEYKDVDENSYLIIIIPNNFKEKEPFENLHVFLADSKKIYKKGRAQGYEGVDGVYRFRNIVWK